MIRETRTENGLVRGIVGTNARVTVFKGIPYAAPPVGENRWRAPQPAENWEGVRECYEFGPIAMQNTPGADPEAFYSKEWHVDPDIAMSEDCLQLNIWTPAKSTEDKLPVMMWIHGGGMQEGYGHEQEFDGEHFAKRSVILVSITYRLNVFAFMAHKELTAAQPDAPCNFGLLDMVAALKWIKRNIVNFGGDPENVTIFGQSGGGAAVQYLCCSPMTVGLFQHAIIQSAGLNAMAIPSLGYFEIGTKDLAFGEEFGQTFLEYLGVNSIEEARKLDAKYINDKQVQYRKETFKFMNPLVDGLFCTQDPGDCMLKNEMNHVDVMVTATGDEFFAGAREPLEDWAKTLFGDLADDYLKVVKYVAGNDKREDLVREADFSTFNASNRLTAEILALNGRKVYFSVFDPYIPGDDVGAFHSCDLWFEFETLMNCWRPFDGHHYELARQMCNYFANFAKTGDPNGLDADGTPMPEWVPYNDGFHAMLLGDEVKMEKEEDPRIRFIIDANLRKYGMK
ncbi:MAG: carboxylesterase family protein [Oscillospiraceae bacterium]|nr:carboxylesterase family protein [Oscillospiraceae bacterium]